MSVFKTINNDLDVISFKEPNFFALGIVLKCTASLFVYLSDFNYI